MNINYEGLVCYLNSNKDSKQNNVWLDSSGNNNNATLTSFSDDDFNGSYVQFNGNNYAIIPRCIQDDFTLSAEVILESSTSTTGPWQLWYNYASLIDAETAGVQNDFGLTISKDGHAYFGIGNPDWTIPYAQKSLFNEKHIITCTRKKDTGEYAMYIDGILIKKEIHPNKNSLTHPSEIYVGKGKNNKFLSMKLFSIRIYNRVLDNFEIKQDSFFVKNKVYVNENNLPIIVDKLMDASNIKIANNKYGNRVQTVIDKIVEKADNVTKAINQELINTGYSFKVGTGTNVDVSSDVQDGFGEVGLKGVTCQNLINTNSNIFFAGSSRYENKVNGNNKKEVKALSDGSMVLYKDGMFKDNTTYTIVAKVYVNRSTQVGFSFKNNDSFTQGLKYLSPISVGNYATYIVPITTTTNCTSVVIGNHGAFLTNDVLGIDKLMVFEGDHTNNPNLPDYFEGIAGVGDKSKNLFNYKDSKEQAFIKIDGTIIKDTRWRVSDYINCKDLTNLFLSGLTIYPNTNSNNFLFYDKNKNLLRNINVNKANSVSVNNNEYYIRFSYRVEDEKNIQLESDITATSYEPYYEGYKIEILSYGKNIYKPNLQTTSARGLTFSLEGENQLVVNGTATDTVDFRPIDASNFPQNPTLNLYKYVNSLPVGTNLTLSNNLNLTNYFGLKRNGSTVYLRNTMTIQDGDSNINCFVRFNKDETNYVNQILNIQLELDSKKTSYQSYQENKTQILLDEPLMRLPNGVCDEITKDGKLIRRIGKIILDGTERDLALNGTSSNHTQFVITNTIKTAQKNNHANLVCNTKPTLVKNEGNNSIWIYIGKTVVFQMQSGMTVDAFRQWLSQNPTTVYYELETPVITDIIPPSVRIYKDGHLTFNTLVAPESTHLVQLNKSAQINNTLEQVQSLNKKVDALDIIYNSLISSTSNTLSNLNK